VQHRHGRVRLDAPDSLRFGVSDSLVTSRHTLEETAVGFLHAIPQEGHGRLARVSAFLAKVL
jgi:hypothetical protein